MIVQSIKAQITGFVLAAVFILAQGVLGYLLGGSAGEILLFISLVCFVVITSVFGFILYKNRNLVRELDKAIEMSMYSNFDPMKRITRLAPIGEKIAELYRNLNQVSEMRVMKITGLNSLNELILDNLNFPAAVLNIEGELVKSNPLFRERILGKENEGAANIRELETSVPVQELIVGMNSQYGPVEADLGKTRFTYYPVRNLDSKIAYIFAVPSRWQLKREETEDRTPPPPRAPNRGSLLRRLVGRRKDET